MLASAEEFAASASKTTVFLTNLLQGLLVACVVLWVLDIPRRVFNVSFYTEQLLTVCLGLTLALAFVGGNAARIPRASTSAARSPSSPSSPTSPTASPNPLDIPPLIWAGLALALAWTFLASRRAFARWFDFASRRGVAPAVRLHLRALRAADLRARDAAARRASSAARSCCSSCSKPAAAPRASASSRIILAMAVYIYISPNLPGDFQTRWVSPERLVAYLGLDVNSMIGTILQVAVLVVIPFTILGQVLARTGGADFFADIAMAAMGRFRGGSAKIAVVGSALFGMISGSAVSNVLAVGIVTIPTMIKSGFSRYKAAAIESVGSTGGQLMPPVMGAAAFIMAEFLQVSYGAVCVAAAIPAHPLLRLPVHPRRSRCRQAEHRRGRGPGCSDACRGDEIGLAFPGADRLPGIGADLPRNLPADAGEGRHRLDRHPDGAHPDLRLPRQAPHPARSRQGDHRNRTHLARHHADRRRRRRHGRDPGHLRSRLQHDAAAASRSPATTCSCCCC